MSRYIDANDLEEMRSTREFYGDAVAELDWTDLCIAAADSIDLVRCAECKNCKRKRGTFKGEPIFFYRCAEHNRDVESDDYCSWGERRE